MSALALLARPRESRGTGAWVISPSPGPEHGNLRRLETLLARSLAAAGDPCLRIRPDLHPVSGATGDIDLDAQAETVEGAVELVRRETGAESVGVIGALFGATVAALVADRLPLEQLVVIEPVVRGRSYIREIVRRDAVAELMDAVGAGAHETSDGPNANGRDRRAASDDEIVTRGVRLGREQLARISEVALDRDLARFRGRALVIGISPTGDASPGAHKLHARLVALGADSTLLPLTDPLPAPFGEYYFQNHGPVRVDTRLPLDQRLAELTTEWALAASG
jgi:hypothetical protein